MTDDENTLVSGHSKPTEEPGEPTVAGQLDAGTTGGALATLALSIGSVPRLLLRDSEREGLTPVSRPLSTELPGRDANTGRYQLLGEIARGGMGAVIKGRDTDLGRDLAVKVLLEEHRDNPDLVRRFIEEAQIGGQLQHPGIVPVYELGCFADSRPFFTMKLVKGRTLAALLESRPDVSHDRARLLAVFEQVCQTMAYAHARGVIHRDLKPSNVMVGSFGEVQVMDWGLAKVLSSGGTADDHAPVDDGRTVIHTARIGSDSDLSSAGSVMGTPAYMAPEQARGEIGGLDERCDVFALGSILCQILTGGAAFTARNAGEMHRKAARGDLAECHKRLDGCEADDEVIALAKDCIAAEAIDRPRDAGEVSQRLTAYFAGVTERLRAAELATVEAHARAEEEAKRAAVERSRRRLTVALAATVMGSLALGASGWTWLSFQRQARQAGTTLVVNQAIDSATSLRAVAQAAPQGDLVKWTEALAAADKAKALLADGVHDPALDARVSGLLSDITRERDLAVARALDVARDRKMADRLEQIRVQTYQLFDVTRTMSEYKDAFLDYGLDLWDADPAATAARIAKRPIRAQLVAAIDQWSTIVGNQLASRQNSRYESTWRKLVSIASAADDDPWRSRLRVLLEGRQGRASRACRPSGSGRSDGPNDRSSQESAR